MRHNTSRTPYRTDTDLALERRGRMSDLTIEDRVAFIQVAELLGCHIAAQHILDDARRRSVVHAAPDPAPRPGPKPHATPATPPILRQVNGSSHEADADDLFWDDVRRVCRRYEGREHELTPLAAAALSAFRRLPPSA